MNELFAKPPGILGHVAMIITINAIIALTLFIVNLLGFLLGLLIFIPALVGFTSFIWVPIAWSPKDWSGGDMVAVSLISVFIHQPVLYLLGFEYL